MSTIARKALLLSSVAIMSVILSTGITAGQQSFDINRGSSINTINTAVPFLRIIPDARSGGMGDVGMAISPDANSAFFNPAKVPFSDKKMGISLSYSPWLRSLGITDIYMAHFGGFYKLDDLQAVHTSLKFFSLGDITFTDVNGTDIGQGSPRELTFDAGYSRKLGDMFGIGVSLRYIYSNLASGQTSSGVEIKAGHAVGTDLGFHFQKDLDLGEKMEGQIAAGLALTNIGSKISYTENAINQDYIPANMAVGTGFTLMPNEYNSIGFFVDINKLLVPTPQERFIEDENGNKIDNPEYDKDGNGEADYREGSPIKGVFTSFGDAPGGAAEEFREFSFGTAIEYWYSGQFAVRAGYFWEHATKGNRKFFTAGVGVKYSVFGLNFSYLVPTSSENNPLDNTLRFSLLFDFDDFGRKRNTDIDEILE